MLSAVNSFYSSNKATNTKKQTCMTLEVSYSCLALVPCPDNCALSGRFFPQHSISGSMGPDQLPWQHWRNGGTCGTLTIGTVLVHTSTPHSHWQLPPTQDDHSRTAKAAPRKGFQYSENHSQRLQCRPAKNTYILQCKRPLKALYTIWFAPTYTCLHCPAWQQCVCAIII